jgi:phospholipid/cholesterol/gamma-HCH transport system permease protein
MFAVVQRVENLGRQVINGFVYTLEVLLMVYLSIRAAMVDQAQGLRTVFSVVSSQIYFTGWQAMPLITVLAMASGGIVVLQSSTQLSIFGGSEMLGNLLVVLIVRELGPLITSLVVIARSGTAVASEIGNMRANREIEALESMGINPLSFIVFPRLVGGVISVVCLTFYFTLIALVGGYLLTRIIHDMPFSFYSASIIGALEVEDFGLFIHKTGFSGIMIFVICCYQGLLVQRSPTEVPQVTTRAVMNSIIYVTCFNLTVSALFYVNQLMKLGIL